jgi:hypothetical protein
MEGKDLALAFVGVFEAAGEALDQEAALGRTVAFANDVLIGAHLLHTHGQGEQRVPLGAGEIGDALQLLSELLGGEGG